MSEQLDMDYYIFDIPSVQNVLLALYSVVFIFCFFGNLTVVLVMAFHWRMKSITKYCIGNLAFANMCVGIFCVYQNFTMFIMGSWPFGNFLCKMFHFVNGLSHTASILILVVISVERYFVILHPFKCRRILTIKRLRLIMLGVWLLSAILNLPRILFVLLIRNPRVSETGKVSDDVICSIGSHLFPSETMEMIQFVLLFILPLIVISRLYYKIGLFLRQREAFREAFVSASLFEYDSDPSDQSTHTQMSLGHSNNTSKNSFFRPSVRMHNEMENTRKNNAQHTRQNNEQLKTEGQVAEEIEQSERENGENKAMENEAENARKNAEQNENEIQQVFPRSNVTGSISEINKQLWDRRAGRKSRFIVRRKFAFRRSGTSNNGQTINKCKTKCSNCRKHQHQHRKKREKCCCLTKRQDLNPGLNRIKIRLKSKEKNYSHNASLRSLHCQTNLVRINFSGSSVCCKDCGFFCSHSKLTSPHRSHKNAVKLLVIIVVTFAVCNFPYHLRKIYQNFFYKPENESDFDELATPITFLLMYANCAINPIVYAFLSKNFRTCLMDVVRLNCKRTSNV